MGTTRSTASPVRPQPADPTISASDVGHRRLEVVARFIERLCLVLTDRTQDHPDARLLVQRMQLGLGARVGETGACDPLTLPVCAHLDTALARVHDGGSDLSIMADLLAELAPRLHWQLRASADATRPPFGECHGNTQIIGPNGIEQHHDLVVGASLLAPHTVYPNHRHPPREVYLVLSDGEWWSERRDWHRPGLGGIVYHPCSMTHAMRSGAAPLLALWCLWPDPARPPIKG